MNRRQYLAATTTTISSIAIAGCSEESDDFEEGNDGGNGNGSGSSQDVKLLNHQMLRENEGEMSESIYVEGEAENVSGGELDYAEVEVKWYNDGSLVDSFLDNINGWSDGETWAFEVQYIGMGEEAREIDDYQIRAGTSL